MTEDQDQRRQTLLKQLRELKGQDPEEEHAAADALLLAYIGDPEITEAFEAIRKWYA